MTDRAASAAKGSAGAATTIAKHSLLIAGHRTSISLETVFWEALKEEAVSRSMSLAALVAEIDAGRGCANLSSAIRVHLFLARHDATTLQPRATQ